MLLDTDPVWKSQVLQNMRVYIFYIGQKAYPYNNKEIHVNGMIGRLR